MQIVMEDDAARGRTRDEQNNGVESKFTVLRRKNRCCGRNRERGAKSRVVAI